MIVTIFRKKKAFFRKKFKFRWIKRKKRKITRVLTRIYRRRVILGKRAYRRRRRRIKFRVGSMKMASYTSRFGAGPESNALVRFTAIQMLHYNIQFGTLYKNAHATSVWFTLGRRFRFLVIDVSWTLIFFRRFLAILCGALVVRRHTCLVNDHAFMNKYFDHLSESSGEPYLAGNWFGGTITNYKRVWWNSYLLSKYLGNFKNFHQLHVYTSIQGMVSSPAPPGVIIVNSARRSRGASGEARAISVPAVNLIDTDYFGIDSFYPVPSNDDSVGSFYFFNHIAAKTAVLMKVYIVLRMYKRKLMARNRYLSKYLLFHKRVNSTRANLGFKENFKLFFFKMSNFLRKYYRGSFGYSSIRRKLLLRRKARRAITKHLLRRYRSIGKVYNNLT